MLTTFSLNRLWWCPGLPSSLPTFSCWEYSLMFYWYCHWRVLRSFWSRHEGTMVKEFACSGDMVDMLWGCHEACWVTAWCTHRNDISSTTSPQWPHHEGRDRDFHRECIKGTPIRHAKTMPETSWGWYSDLLMVFVTIVTHHPFVTIMTHLPVRG